MKTITPKFTIDFNGQTMTLLDNMADADIKVVGLSSSKGKKPDWKIISAIIGIVVLAIGVIAGIFLVRQQQDVRERAEGNCENPETIVQCPRSDGALVSCNPPDENNNAQISLCNVAGRVEICGLGSNIREYCCPRAGGSWTTDMSACTCNITGPTGLTVEETSSTTAKLKWTPGTGGVSRLWVSKNQDPTGNCSAGGAANCLVDDQTMQEGVGEYELTGLVAGTKYYWRVVTWSREGCDSGSQVANFTFGSSSSSQSPTATATSTATSTGQSTKTPTQTATSTSTSTGSSSTKTPTVKPSATASATSFPVPETGVNIPTLFGAGIGAVLILISLVLAL